jgi:hypothetical protein
VGGGVSVPSATAALSNRNELLMGVCLLVAKVMRPAETDRPHGSAPVQTGWEVFTWIDIASGIQSP